MKGIFGFLTSVVLLVCFSSCQKEVDGSLPNQPANDSTVLWKYVVIDTTLTAGLDTLEVYYFEYDNQKRLSRIRFYSREDTSSSPAYPYSDITDFVYNGNETKPAKSLEISLEGTDSQWDTTYFSYQNGLVSLDSARVQINNITGNAWGIVTSSFTVSGTIVNTTNKFYSYFNPNPSCVTTSAILLSYANGNIVTENGTSSGCVTGSGDVHFTYDNKANPFYSAIPVHYPITDYGFMGNDQKSNMTEEMSVSSGVHTIRSYTYGGNGLPKIVRGERSEFPCL